MKKCLIIGASPNPTGFGEALTKEFIDGLTTAGNEHKLINLFQAEYLEDIDFLTEDYKSLIMECDGIAFSFPWWWEMPPYPLVAFLQKIFTNGFAYKHDGVKTPILDLPTQLIITMGQVKPCNLTNLVDGMEYCGLHIKNSLVAQNVGPRLDPAIAETYLKDSHNAGLNFFN